MTATALEDHLSVLEGKMDEILTAFEGGNNAGSEEFQAGNEQETRKHDYMTNGNNDAENVNGKEIRDENSKP